MKNGINTGQFWIKTGSRGNGRKNPFPKYGNGIPQIRKRTEESRKRNGSGQDFFCPFSTLPTRHLFFCHQKWQLVCLSMEAEKEIIKRGDLQKQEHEVSDEDDKI